MEFTILSVENQDAGVDINNFDYPQTDDLHKAIMINPKVYDVQPQSAEFDYNKIKTGAVVTVGFKTNIKSDVAIAIAKLKTIYQNRGVYVRHIVEIPSMDKHCPLYIGIVYEIKK